MSDIQGGSVLRRGADVRYRLIEDEGVVVRQGAGEVLVLNDLGTRILVLADGTTPVAGWIEILLAEYEVERAQLERDVIAFAAELVEQGLLEPAADGGREAGEAGAAPAHPAERDA